VALAVLVVLVSIIFGGAAGAVTGRVFAPDPASPTAEVPVPPDEVLHEMFAKVSASVVDIEGSGTSTSGEPETATITVTFANGTTASGSVIGISTTHDLAVVKVPKTGLSPLTFADSDGLEVGDLVVAIGNALALAGGPTMSIGIVSALNRSIPTDHGNLTGLIQTSAGISSGDSGGPLLDPSGNVVGINTAAASGDDETVVENIGFAIPSDVARAVLTDLASG
jgi:S1-C subfamily serine protease